MGISDRTETVVNTPVRKELFGCDSGELRAPVRRFVVRDAEGDKRRAQGSDESGGTVDESFYNGPAGISIYNHQVGVAFVVKKIGTQTLEGPRWESRWWW